MPRLIKLYITNVALGFALSAVFLGLMLGLDLAGFRHLILESPSGWIAGLMFFVSNGIVFAGVQFAIAIMGLAEKDGTPRGGLRAPLALIPAKVKVTATTQNRRKSR